MWFHQWMGGTSYPCRMNWLPSSLRLHRGTCQLQAMGSQGLQKQVCLLTDGPTNGQAEPTSQPNTQGPGSPLGQDRVPLVHHQLFWQLCIRTNKVNLFSELHPVCVSAYPAPMRTWG